MILAGSQREAAALGKGLVRSLSRTKEEEASDPRQGSVFFFSLCVSDDWIVPVVRDLFDDVATICNLHWLGPV